MARSWEAEFMELWRAGVETAEIAKRMGIPQGTVSSRAHTLQLQGKIEPRPRGGAQRQRVAQARQEHPPAPPAPRTAERKEIQQWTVRLSKALIERIKAVAYDRRIHPSQLLEELAWQALNGRHASPP